MTRRGFTLIEMLVVTAVAVVVVGMTLGIADESQKTTERILHQQGALQYCQAAIDAAERVLQGAVAPGDLPQAGVASQLQFKGDQLTIATYAAGDKPGLQLLTLRNHASGAGLPSTPQKVLQAVNPATGQAAAETDEDLVRLAPQGFTAALHFGYAGAAEPGRPVNYADSWSGPGLPKLIQVTVTALSQDAETTRSMKLQTAVIPGLVAQAGGTP